MSLQYALQLQREQPLWKIQLIWIILTKVTGWKVSKNGQFFQFWEKSALWKSAMALKRL